MYRLFSQVFEGQSRPLGFLLSTAAFTLERHKIASAFVCGPVHQQNGLRRGFSDDSTSPESKRSRRATTSSSELRRIERDS